MQLVDFHTHILPGADHGSYNIETSVGQLDMAYSVGITRIIATSHFYPHRHFAEKYVKRRNDSYTELVTNPKYNGVQIKLGAEVLLCSGIERLPGLNDLCFLGTKILLIELPFSQFIESYADSVRALISLGYKVILAHADRYSPVVINRLISYGVQLQLNADSLDTLFKKKHLYDWIDKDLVVGIGSDIHKLDKSAYKHYDRVCKKIGEDAYFNIMKKSNEIWESIAVL